MKARIDSESERLAGGLNHLASLRNMTNQVRADMEVAMPGIFYVVSPDLQPSIY